MNHIKRLVNRKQLRAKNFEFSDKRISSFVQDGREVKNQKYLIRSLLFDTILISFENM